MPDKKARLTIAEFAAAVGTSQMNAINALRRDSTLPKAERAYPFIESVPPETRGGKWRYNIPRVQFEQWQAGRMAPVIDYDALAAALVPKLLAGMAAAFVSQERGVRI
jgi:hypothetical protein